MQIDACIESGYLQIWFEENVIQNMWHRNMKDTHIHKHSNKLIKHPVVVPALVPGKAFTSFSSTQCWTNLCWIKTFANISLGPCVQNIPTYSKFLMTILFMEFWISTWRGEKARLQSLCQNNQTWENLWLPFFAAETTSHTFVC